MINRRHILNTSEFEYQCCNCGWWWDIDKYCAGALLSEIRDTEGEVSTTAWACDFCIVDCIERNKLLHSVHG